jgi:hypothetical protein
MHKTKLQGPDNALRCSVRILVRITAIERISVLLLSRPVVLRWQRPPPCKPFRFFLRLSSYHSMLHSLTEYHHPSETLKHNFSFYNPHEMVSNVGHYLAWATQRYFLLQTILLVFMAVTMNNATAFWDVAPYSLVDSYQRTP